MRVYHDKVTRFFSCEEWNSCRNIYWSEKCVDRFFSPFPLRYESFEQIFKSTIKRLDEVTRGRANEIRANWRVPFRKYSYEKIVTFELRILYIRDKERKKKWKRRRKIMFSLFVETRTVFPNEIFLCFRGENEPFNLITWIMIFEISKTVMSLYQKYRWPYMYRYICIDIFIFAWNKWLFRLKKEILIIQVIIIW